MAHHDNRIEGLGTSVLDCGNWYDTLGIAIGTVMSRLSRARQELQERLSARETGGANAPIPFRRGGR